MFISKLILSINLSIKLINTNWIWLNFAKSRLPFTDPIGRLINIKTKHNIKCEFICVILKTTEPIDLKIGGQFLVSGPIWKIISLDEATLFY